MGKRLHMFGCGVVLACLLLTPALARGHTVTTQLDEVYSGATPLGPAPWLTLRFKDYAPNLVLLTVTTTDILAPEFVSEIEFNYNPLKNVKNLAFTSQSGVAFKSVALKANGEHAGPIHTFDVDLAFATANNGKRLGPGATASILISSTKPGETLEALDFNFFTLYRGEHVAAAAHIQGIPLPSGSGSAWVGSEVLVAMPEPSTMLLAGLGLAVLARMRRGRRQGARV